MLLDDETTVRVYTTVPYPLNVLDKNRAVKHMEQRLKSIQLER